MITVDGCNEIVWTGGGNQWIVELLEKRWEKWKYNFFDEVQSGLIPLIY